MKGKFTRAGIQAVLLAAGLDTVKSKKLTAQIISAMFSALVAGKAIELRGLGTLEPRERKARILRNPKNMEPVNIPAHKAVFFIPGRSLKRVLRGNIEI